MTARDRPSPVQGDFTPNETRPSEVPIALVAVVLRFAMRPVAESTFECIPEEQMTDQIVATPIDDFTARSSDELTLAKGDRVELVERDDEFGDGWFLGKHLTNGNSGLFPEGTLKLRVDLTSSVAPSLPFWRRCPRVVAFVVSGDETNVTIATHCSYAVGAIFQVNKQKKLTTLLVGPSPNRSCPLTLIHFQSTHVPLLKAAITPLLLSRLLQNQHCSISPR